jgi:hypothetical protein
VEVVRTEDLAKIPKSRYNKIYGIMQGLKFERVVVWENSAATIKFHKYKEGTLYFPGSFYLIADSNIADLDIVVTVNYKYVDETPDFTASTYMGATYYDRIYSGEHDDSVQITIPKYSLVDKEIYPVTMPKNVFQIDSVTVNGCRITDKFSVVMFASNFSNLFASLKIGKIFDLFRLIRSAFFAHTKYCPQCDGTGAYEGSICPACLGTGLGDLNARGYLLKLTGQKYGLVKDSIESDEGFAWRIHSRALHVNDTQESIAKAIAYFLDLDIEMVEFDIRYSNHCPTVFIGVPGNFGIASQWKEEKARYLGDFVKSIEPAGINFFIAFVRYVVQQIEFADALMFRFCRSRLGDFLLNDGYVDSLKDSLGFGHETAVDSNLYDTDWIDVNTTNFAIPPWSSIGTNFSVVAAGHSRPSSSKLLAYDESSGEDLCDRLTPAAFSKFVVQFDINIDRLGGNCDVFVDALIASGIWFDGPTGKISAYVQPRDNDGSVPGEDLRNCGNFELSKWYRVEMEFRFDLYTDEDWYYKFNVYKTFEDDLSSEKDSNSEETIVGSSGWLHMETPSVAYHDVVVHTLGDNKFWIANYRVMKVGE